MVGRGPKFHFTPTMCSTQVRNARGGHDGELWLKEETNALMKELRPLACVGGVMREMENPMGALHRSKSCWCTLPVHWAHPQARMESKERRGFAR
jgi:hypothetical protein